MREVAVHTTLLGGGFGRRVETIEAVQAAQLAKETGRPVQVVWPREEDIRHDFYRPASVHRLVAGLDPSGKMTCWTHRIASPTIAESKGMVMDGVDPYAVEGAADLPYGVPSVVVEHALARSLGVPCGFWRSVAHSSNAFAVECFVDEVAAAAGVDPVAFRLQRLADAPRHRAVLERVAALAGWPTPSTPGHHLGVALHASFGSYVGQVAEVSVATDGAIRVHRVVCVVDCGRTVNPDTIVAQVEGGIVFGLSAALHGRITLRAGEVIESNFHDYRVLKMSEMPEIVVEILPSQEPPGGVGEIAGPPAAPAVANAVSAALGRRIRRLPMQPPE